MKSYLKKIILSLGLLIMSGGVLEVNAYEERNLLQQHISPADLKQSLVLEQKWVPFPAYSDRQGWNDFLGDAREKQIREGEKVLNYEWQVVKCTDYLEFDRTGNRRIMEQKFYTNLRSLASLFAAELAEGKGRFIDQIINGAYYFSEMASWSCCAHLCVQPGGGAVPSTEYKVIDLHSTEVGSLMAWIYYYLHNQFDKINPFISKRIYNAVKSQIMDPYMKNDNYWWMGVNYRKGQMLNNWNPFCNSYVLLTFMLLENDADALGKAVQRNLESVDKYLNYVNADGGCEEGPAYWGIAPGKLLDYLDVLKLATGGRVDIFQEPQIRKMAEYISRSYIGDGYVVNFADASPRSGFDPYLVYRFGKSVGSDELMHLAAMRCNDTKKPLVGTDFYRCLSNIAIDGALRATEPKHIPESFTWYPQTELCFLRNDVVCLASKGGHNNESHNHNDVGTFSLWKENTPLFIDAGVGTYNAKYFSNKRYTIWCTQSEYHNLPMINGVGQAPGSQHRATHTKAKKNYFSLDIAKAYPAEAKVEKWVRSYQLKEHEVIIEDDFVLKEIVGDNQVIFLCWGDVELKSNHVVLTVNQKQVKMYFNPNDFFAAIETLKMTEPVFKKNWGDVLYRLTFKAKQQKTIGKYNFTIKY